MGLLAEIYSVFGLGYTIALAILKHEDLSRSDKAFIAATVAFLVLSIGSFFNKVRLIPSGYKWRFTGKSLLRGLLGPLLSLLHYPILFYSKDCVKWAFTFSNEAHDGVERTRQLEIFELDELGSSAPRYLIKHSLYWYGKEKKWGYERLVGEIWVKVRFEAQFNVDTSRKLQTSDLGRKLLLQYQRDIASQQGPEPILEVNTESVHVPEAKQERVKVSCLDCVCVELESGSNPARPKTPAGTLPATPPPLQPPPTSQNPSTSPTQPPPTSQNPPTPLAPPPLQPVPTSQNSPTPPNPPPLQPLPTSQNSPTPPAPPPPPPPPTSQNPPTPPTPPPLQPVPTSQNSPTPPAPPAPPPLPPPPTSQNSATPPTSQNPPEQYTVTITRKRAMHKIQRGECWLCPGCTWNLSSTVVRNWTLFQIHQYMLCLDVWGNHPKQGIWKPHEPETCCSGDTSCCTAFTRIKTAFLSSLPGQRSTNLPKNNQASKKIKFRYCYRHDELIDAIGNNRRLTSRPNNATWHTVV